MIGSFSNWRANKFYACEDKLPNIVLKFRLKSVVGNRS